MRSRGNLRHHAAEWAVRLILPYDRLREDLPFARDQRRRRVVAGGFEAEDQRHGAPFAAVGRARLVARRVWG